MPQQTSWIEKTFIEPQGRFEIAIHFPQGARAVKSKGRDAGKSSQVNIFFAVEIKYQNENTWIPLSGISFSGIKKDGFTLTKEYIGGNVNQPPPPPLVVDFDQSRAFTVRIRRETQQIATNEVADEVEKTTEYRYYYNSILHTITGYSATNKKPVTDPRGVQLAKTAVSILATNQLNGQIDGINALAQTYCLDWNGTSWVMANTSNPASLFLYVLTHPGNPQQIKTGLAQKVDLERLQYWHQYCNQTRTLVRDGDVLEYKFEYNNVLSNVRSVLEVLRDIAAAGRASPALVDGKWSVNIDEPKDVVQHFTPHNSWGFESTKVLPRIPDGLKIRFFNEDKDYREDELIVYNYEKNSGNAELFESITLPGVTNSVQVEDHGKWHFAQIKLRPEVYTLNTDIEYLVCNRGDRVKVTHDVPMWGLGSGRIKNRLSPTLFQLDEKVFMQAGTRYTMRVRSSTGESTAREVVPAEYNIISYSASAGNVTLKLNTPHHFQVGDIVTVLTSIPAINGSNIQITQISTDTIRYVKAAPFAPINTPVSGSVKEPFGYISYVQTLSALTEAQANDLDLFLFGELDKESADLIVLSVEPTSGTKNARLTLVDYGITDTYNIFNDYKNLTEVTYETLITDKNPKLSSSLQAFKPEITTSGIVSDRRAMEEVSPGVFAYGILVPFTNPEDVPDSAEFVEAEYVRATLSGHYGTLAPQVTAISGSVLIKNVDLDATYKIRLRYLTSTGIFGMWTEWVSHKVVGKVASPSDVTNFQGEVVETGIKYSWDNSLDPDYAYTIIKAVEIPEQTPPEYDIEEVLWEDTENIVEIFKGNTNRWTWTKPSKGFNRTLIKHVDVYGNESEDFAETTLEFKDNPLEVEDLTPPPPPTNLTATATYLTINLQWTIPTYDLENPIGRGHGGNIIYVAEWPQNTAQPALASAKIAATLNGNTNTFVFAGDPGIRYVFWVKEVTKGRGVSLTAAGPVDVTTGVNNIERLMSTLTEQIREEHLWATLNGRINLIDDPVEGLLKKTADLQAIYGTVISASGSAVLASGYALLASGSAAASANNALLASGSAAASADNALLASGSALASANNALLASGSAMASASNAILASGSAMASANNSILASGSALIASGYALLAGSGAVSASGSAVIAATQAFSASGSASAAALNASGASSSASNASGSAAAASGSFVLAQTQAAFASGSAAASAFSASGAAISSVNASGASAQASGFLLLANTAANFASGSAAAAAFSASGASLSSVTASGASASASGSLALAQTAANFASGSAAAAAFSASGASVSSVTASGASASASGSLALANTAANFASGSAAAAAFSASGASLSSVTASGSAASASGSLALAQTAANFASGSAAAAAFSASGASVSSVTASGSAASASGSLALANTAANTATNQASAAALSASGASVSSTNASGSAASASGSLALATTRANAASGSASAAALSASGASVSATDASGSAASASGSLALANTAANTATNQASAAALSASGASVSSTNASGSAASASGSLALANTAASTATNQASAAALSASGASVSSTNASGSAASASGSLALATTRANAASGSASAAALSASGASVSATDASGSAASASGSLALAVTAANTATNQASAAALSASGASVSSTNASGSAASASGSLALATTRANAASGSASAAALSASGASVSSTNASGSAASASGSLALAVTAANTAGNSATAAGISASGASVSATSASGSAAAASGVLVLAQASANNASGSAANASISQSGAASSAITSSGAAVSAANSLSQAQALVSGTSATVAQKMTARAASNGNALSEYSVVVNANGKIAGFGLGATVAGSASSSTFSVMADKFVISDGSSDTAPFIVTNGVTFIKNAQIATAAIDTLKIANNAVTVPLVAVSTTDIIGSQAVGIIGYDTVWDPEGGSYQVPIYGGVPIFTYSFSMPNAGKAIFMWQAETESTRYCWWSIYLNDVRIGYNRAGGYFQDAPVMIAQGDVSQGTNVVKIYWTGSESLSPTATPGGTILQQRVVVLGAQR